MERARANAIAAMQDEYRRLLYVAMTRARERLVIAGTGIRNKKLPDGCWYDLMNEALRPETKEVDGADGEKIWLHSKSVAPAARPIEEIKAAGIILPTWLTRDVSAEPAPPIAITPSGSEDHDWIAGSGADGTDALLRGRLLHRLMQSLPDIAPVQRADAAKTYLVRAGASS